MSVGLLLVLISVLGYISNFLNWRFLSRLFFVRWFYWVGVFIHEFSHALLCVLMGAKIEKFEVFSSTPQVIHRQSKIPLIGEVLISIAPIFGGILFLLLFSSVLQSYFFNWNSIFSLNFGELKIFLYNLIFYFDFTRWQDWLLAFLSFNIGAMVGPSFQDLKNIWVVALISFFIKWPFLIKWLSVTVALIIFNIFLQVVSIILFAIFNFLKGYIIRK